MTENQKTRVPNFTEKAHLMRIIAHKYANILEDKKTGHSSSEKKEKAWQCIENEFNACSTNIYRNAASLKKCYENRKKELRKSLAEERKEVMLTGGGPPSKIKRDETDDLLISIINEKTLVGLNQRYDDDAEVAVIDLNNGINNEIVFEYITEADDQSQVVQQGTSASTMIPDSKVLAEGIQEESNNKENVSWKKYTPEQLKTPISAPLTHPIEETASSSGINKKIPTKSTSRRRPMTVIKPLTSSVVAKKYDQLLDKRLQVVDAQLKHAEEEHALTIRKQKLEVEILELELKNKRENIFKNS